ncbi:hypothetical protein CWR53_12740 [Pseudomonas sp. SGAir0191]|uniref:hypothetical protein n=1 Tax=Pseudomonas sp. SGAir0191 TaxID=2217867 RepID=UPI000C2CBA6A|nr:hypothetical protein [Pseudomonas sp. SGAir0191]AUA33399.1 hypothetical protein CWR53_12740 [Pseudomonas sp. SGAir0191]
MYIKSFCINIICSGGHFGFSTDFQKGLNIIRGSNSSGKSTIVNCLLYSLGMEELVGGKGEAALSYAVRDYVIHDEKKHAISESYVTIEIENRQGRVSTIRRWIKSANHNTKLAEVSEVASPESYTKQVSYKFIHDNYSAVYKEGFFTYLESFLGLQLPKVHDSNGKQVKLYLQAIFAALAIEQKRGWTDYIANIPYYSVSNARVRVVEFLLGLGVFEQESKRMELDLESVKLHNDWTSKQKEISSQASLLRLSLTGLSTRITSDFDQNKVEALRIADGEQSNLYTTIASLKKKYKDLDLAINPENGSTGSLISEELQKQTSTVTKLAADYETSLSNLTIYNSTLSAHIQIKQQTQEELTRNKTTKKLREYGASKHIHTAEDSCPTCHQHIEDSLVSINLTGTAMDIDTNIYYLESQAKMLAKQEAGIELKIRDAEIICQNLAAQLEKERSILNSLRRDATRGSAVSQAAVKKQVLVEWEIEKLEEFSDQLEDAITVLHKLSLEFKTNQNNRKNLPKDRYTDEDKKRIRRFSQHFRGNAGEFDYLSAEIEDIVFNEDTLLPQLSRLELREIVDSPSDAKTKAQAARNGNMAQNSSASDFVRLIWSYIMALYQTASSRDIPGNHPGFIMMDEPGQHSMATKSQQALFRMLANQTNFQAIVAASFDDLDAVFKESTEGVKFKYIHLEGKCIVPLSTI